MIPFLANIDPAFKVLAPRAADWLTILPEIAVAALALVSLLQMRNAPVPMVVTLEGIVTLVSPLQPENA